MHRPSRKTSKAILAALLIPACHKQERDKRAVDDSAPAHDSGPATDPDCDTGILDDDGDCVPAACGSGTWGDLQLDENTVYVDIAAAAKGDGSEGTPFTSIQAGLDAAGDAGGGMVAVAAGSYPETLDLNRGHDGVRLAGRCRELVTIDASAGDEQTAGIDLDIGSSEVEVRGVTVSASHSFGVLVGAGTVTIRDSQVEGSAYVGIAVHQVGLYQTSLTVESCELLENRVAGVVAFDASTSVTLRETTIRDSWPGEDGLLGFGIDVYGGAILEAEACVLMDNATTGVIAFESDTSVTLRETTIQGTGPNQDGEFGYGIAVEDGARLEAEACQIAENTTGGVVVSGPSTTVHACLVKHYTALYLQYPAAWKDIGPVQVTPPALDGVTSTRPIPVRAGFSTRLLHSPGPRRRLPGGAWASIW